MHAPLVFIWMCFRGMWLDHTRSISVSICKWCESICERISALESWGVFTSLSHQKTPQHVGLHLVFMSCSYWCCWLMSFDGNCRAKGQAVLVKKVNAWNPLRRNPPIIVGKERGVFSLWSCQDYCLLLNVQQKCVQEHKYFFLSVWFSFDVSLAKIIPVSMIAKLNFCFIVYVLKHTQKLIRIRTANLPGENEHTEVFMLVISFPTMTLSLLRVPGQIFKITPFVSPYNSGTSHNSYNSKTREQT